MADIGIHGFGERPDTQPTAALSLYLDHETSDGRPWGYITLDPAAPGGDEVTLFFEIASARNLSNWLRSAAQKLDAALDRQTSVEPAHTPMDAPALLCEQGANI